jgi:hypothetical protein
MGVLKHTFDSKCYDLARDFLDDEGSLNSDKYINELAQEIQNTIENFIEYERAKLEPKAPIPGEE